MKQAEKSESGLSLCTTIVVLVISKEIHTMKDLTPAFLTPAFPSFSQLFLTPAFFSLICRERKLPRRYKDTKKRKKAFPLCLRDSVAKAFMTEGDEPSS